MPYGPGAFQLAILAIVLSQPSSWGSLSGSLLMAAFHAALHLFRPRGQFRIQHCGLGSAVHSYPSLLEPGFSPCLGHE